MGYYIEVLPVYRCIEANIQYSRWDCVPYVVCGRLSVCTEFITNDKSIACFKRRYDIFQTESGCLCEESAENHLCVFSFVSCCYRVVSYPIFNKSVPLKRPDRIEYQNSHFYYTVP